MTDPGFGKRYRRVIKRIDTRLLLLLPPLLQLSPLLLQLLRVLLSIMSIKRMSWRKDHIEITNHVERFDHVG